MFKQYLKRFLTAVNLGNAASLIWQYARYAYVLGARAVKSVSKSPSSVKIEVFDSPNREVFFGYYDITPFSSDENFLLAMHAPVPNVAPGPETDIMVGYYDLREKNSPFRVIGKTSTWCWQQGCRLQWYPENSNQEVLYNRLVEGQYGCVIQNIKTKKTVRTLKRAVYSASKDGNWGLSLNFSRLHRLRPGYGYVNFSDETKGQLAPREEGIWLIDMKTGETRLLFSVAEIASFETLDSMNGAEHYFNHILFNPDGTRFMFFHVWLKNNKRFTRLITCDINGNRQYALINEGYVSHYCWKSNDELLAYSTHANTGTNFHLYKDESDVRKIIGKGILNQDGHPSFSPDGSLLLTDTYPDKLREQHLFIFRFDNNNLVRIGSFFSPLEFESTEVRCDLHPRWSPCGQYICFDSAHEGKRAMCLVDVGKYLNFHTIGTDFDSH